MSAHERAAAGWGGAAVAIHDAQQLHEPGVLQLNVATGPIVIDLDRHTSSAPEEPVQDLDGLLWRIGFSAFGEDPAPWMSDRDRYRLTRWPNLGALPADVDEVRMFAILANVDASPAELAATAGRTIGKAQRVLNALSLMGILRTSPTAPAPVLPPEPPTETPGFFRRLLRRLGA